MNNELKLYTLRDLVKVFKFPHNVFTNFLRMMVNNNFQLAWSCFVVIAAAAVVFFSLVVFVVFVLYYCV